MINKNSKLLQKIKQFCSNALFLKQKKKLRNVQRTFYCRQFLHRPPLIGTRRVIDENDVIALQTGDVTPRKLAPALVLDLGNSPQHQRVLVPPEYPRRHVDSEQVLVVLVAPQVFPLRRNRQTLGVAVVLRHVPHLG